MSVKHMKIAQKKQVDKNLISKGYKENDKKHKNKVSMEFITTSDLSMELIMSLKYFIVISAKYRQYS